MSLMKFARLGRYPLNRMMLRDPFFYYPEWHIRELEYEQQKMQRVFEKVNEVFEALYEDPRATPKSQAQRKPQESANQKQNDQATQKETQHSMKKEATQSPDKETEASNKNQHTTARQEGVSEERRRRDMVNRYGRNHWFDDYIDLFNSDRKGSQTFERANKIFEQSAQKDKPDLILEENDELLRGIPEFEEYLKFFNRGGKGDFSATSYESSTIFKNGKKVTVSKQSEMNPDGTIKTQVSQEFYDEKGNKDARRWVKEDNYKKPAESLEGAQSN